MLIGYLETGPLRHLLFTYYGYLVFSWTQEAVSGSRGVEQSRHHVGPKLGKAVSPSQTSALPAEEEGAAFPKSPEGEKQQCVKGAGSQGRQHLLRCPSLVVTGHWGVGEQQMSLDVCSAGLKGQPGYLEKE